MPSIGKPTYNKYLRRHSPLKLRNYCTSNDTYFLEKSNESYNESHGFLSIVKINTRSQLDSIQDFKRKTSLNKEERELTGSRKERDISGSKKEKELPTKKDIVIEDISDEKEHGKENDSSIKVSRLINEK